MATNQGMAVTSNVVLKEQSSEAKNRKQFIRVVLLDYLANGFDGSHVLITVRVVWIEVMKSPRIFGIA